MHFLTEAIIIGLMLLFNALFAAYEMALASISRARLATLAQSGGMAARAALAMKTRLEGSLAVVQLGITLTGAIGAATGGAAVDEFLSPWLSTHWGMPSDWADFAALALFVIPMSMLTITFAELTPKMFALRNKEAVVLALSVPMRVLSWSFHPAIRAFEGSVKWALSVIARVRGDTAPPADTSALQELRAAVTLAKAERVIGALEERIVTAAAQFSSRRLQEIMLPARDIFMIAADRSLADALIEAHLHMHTRYPVCETAGDPQTIRGYVNFKDIVTALRLSPQDPSLKSIVRPIQKLPALATLAQAIDSMIREKSHIALALAPDGLVAGLVTLEDLVEELVGDISDEYDRLPAHLHALGNAWIAGGGIAMEAIWTALQMALPLPPALAPQKLADWCDIGLTTPPDCGLRIRRDGLDVEVRKVRRQRVLEAVVRKAAGP
ncbi:MAG: hemolysin family protein [Lentisphaerae bacterium]|nr:hemolysin family protein [Lentisphaerota bacterium]